MLKYRGNIKDQWIDFKYWGMNWLSILGLVASNPCKVITSLFKYPVIYHLLKVNHLAKTLNVDRNGTALLLSEINLHYFTKGVLRQLQTFVYGAQDSILENSMIPTEIYQAMDLKVICAELLGNLDTFCDHRSAAAYLDAIENNGLPSDTCSYTRISAGVFASGEMPRNVKAFVTNNLPCEGGLGSNVYYADNLDVPIYRLDSPYYFKKEDSLDAFVEDIRGMISFLEEHTGHRMNWNKLREVLERENRIDELELERWDMAASEIPALASENIWMQHWWHYNLEPGHPESLKWYNEQHEHIKKAYESKEPALKNLRYRTVMWNTPPLMFSGFWSWLERCWGIAMLNDMMTYGHFEDMFIDTNTNETMLKGLAGRWCSHTMSRHTRGAVEDFLPDIWQMVERFQADFFLVAGHIGCRSSVAMTGLMKEECRKRDIPICIFDYELLDSRVCSRQGIRDQINHFMFNVMKAKPLDENLLVFDDAAAW